MREFKDFLKSTNAREETRFKVFIFSFISPIIRYSIIQSIFVLYSLYVYFIPSSGVVNKTGEVPVLIALAFQGVARQ